MFGTAFIWGLGASCGASIGVLMLSVFWRFLDRVLAPVERAADAAQKALERRNELTESTILAIQRVAEAIEDRQP